MKGSVLPEETNTLMLPPSSYAPEGPSAEAIKLPPGQRKTQPRPVIAVFFGDYKTMVECPGGTALEGAEDAATPLRAYVHNTSLLHEPTPMRMMTVHSCGEVVMWALDGPMPYVYHRVRSTGTMGRLLKLAGARPNSSAPCSAPSYALDGNIIQVTCASVISAELAVRQMYCDLGDPLTLAKSGHFDEGAARAAPTGTKEYSDEEAEAADTRQASWGDYSSVCRKLWRGIVGTNRGDVFVFDGDSYTVGFSTGKSLLQVHVVVTPPSLITKLDQRTEERFTAGLRAGNYRRKENQPEYQEAGDGVPQDGDVALRDRRGNNGLSSIGFVTMHYDGSVLCWARSIDDGRVLSPAISVRQPGFFSRLRALAVTHRYWVPLTLTDWQPRFSSGIAADLHTSAPRISKKKTTGAQGRYSRLGNAFACQDSPDASEPLPFGTLLMLGGNGWDNQVTCVLPTGEPVERAMRLAAGIRCTRAIAIDEDVALVGRGKSAYLLYYKTMAVRKLFRCRTAVVNVVLHRPFAIVGCSGGDIYIISTNTGELILRTRTRAGDDVRCLCFHHQAMLIAAVGIHGDCELFQLPGHTVRIGSPAEGRMMAQTMVLRLMLAMQEGARIPRRTALELKLLAQLSVPGCVQQYLGPQRILY